MGKQIEALVESCNICLERHNSFQKEPMISHPIPERPWQAIAIDLLTWNNTDHIIAVDYYSRCFEVEKNHQPHIQHSRQKTQSHVY